MLKDSKPISPSFAKEITSITLQGLLYLSDWTAKILQQSAWKYSKPSAETKNSNNEEILIYERVFMTILSIT